MGSVYKCTFPDLSMYMYIFTSCYSTCIHVHVQYVHVSDGILCIGQEIFVTLAHKTIVVPGCVNVCNVPSPHPPPPPPPQPSTPRQIAVNHAHKANLQSLFYQRMINDPSPHSFKLIVKRHNLVQDTLNSLVSEDPQNYKKPLQVHRYADHLTHSLMHPLLATELHLRSHPLTHSLLLCNTLFLPNCLSP